ncbi:MAG TPA: hypothetical protein EYN67_19690 [Flavobacteriales bacterium]|nr:hypothetical protein [Flavobacteriales bacterium]
MSTISISNIVSEAWALFKEHASSIIVIMLVYFGTTILISLIGIGVTGASIIMSVLFQVLQSVIGVILALGFYKIFLNILDGQTPDIHTLFSQTSPNLIIHSFVGSIVMALAVMAGLIFLIIPGLYIAFRLQFFNLVLLDQDEPNFSEALKSSWEMTRGYVLDLLGIAIISAFIVMAGILALFVGIFIAIPVVSLMGVLVYRKLKANYTELPK